MVRIKSKRGEWDGSKLTKSKKKKEKRKRFKSVVGMKEKKKWVQKFGKKIKLANKRLKGTQNLRSVQR